ncbi:MAG: hypothetical protein AAFO82_20255, partial [Bacteroidota bacterium]
MKVASLIMLLGIILCSCSSYTATLEKHDQLQNDAIRAYPAWKYKQPGTKKAIAPLIATAAGAAYGYQNETTIDNNTYTEGENALIWGAGGLVLGGILNAIIFPSHTRSKSRFSIEQSDKWLRSFNRSTGKDYVLSRKDLNNTLVLLPRKKMQGIRERFRTLEMDLKSDTPMTSFKELQRWERKLKGEYAIMPMEELELVNQLIATYRSKVARRNLLIEMDDIEQLATDYDALQKLQGMKNNSYSLYNEADQQTQRDFDDLIKKKTSNILSILMEEEERILESIETNMGGLRKLNTFAQQFYQKYNIWFGHPIVENTNQKILQKINSIIIAQNQKLQSRIRSYDNLANLRKFEDVNIEYFKR